MLPAAVVAPAIPILTEATAPISEVAGQIATFFTADGDKLELIDNRLKVSNQSDYVRRLTVLFSMHMKSLGGRQRRKMRSKALLQRFGDPGEDGLKASGAGHVRVQVAPV